MPSSRTREQWVKPRDVIYTVPSEQNGLWGNISFLPTRRPPAMWELPVYCQEWWSKDHGSTRIGHTEGIAKLPQWMTTCATEILLLSSQAQPEGLEEQCIKRQKVKVQTPFLQPSPWPWTGTLQCSLECIPFGHPGTVNSLCKPNSIPDLSLEVSPMLTVFPNATIPFWVAWLHDHLKTGWFCLLPHVCPSTWFSLCALT